MTTLEAITHRAAFFGITIGGTVLKYVLNGRPKSAKHSSFSPSSLGWPFASPPTPLHHMERGAKISSGNFPCPFAKGKGLGIGVLLGVRAGYAFLLSVSPPRILLSMV